MIPGTRCRCSQKILASRLLHCCDCRPCPRHRAECCCLFGHQRGSAEAAGLSRRRSHRRVLPSASRGWRHARVQSRVDSYVSRVSAAGRRFSGSCGIRLYQPWLQSHRRPTGTTPRHSRDRRLFPAARCSGGAGTHFHARRRFAERRQGGRLKLRPLAAKVRRRQEYRRKDTFPRQRAIYDFGRDPAVLFRLRSRHLAAFSNSPPSATTTTSFSRLQDGSSPVSPSSRRMRE